MWWLVFENNQVDELEAIGPYEQEPTEKDHFDWYGFTLLLPPVEAETAEEAIRLTYKSEAEEHD